MLSRLRGSLRERAKFNAKDFDVILSKCRSQTTYGKFLNILFSVGLQIVRTLKDRRRDFLRWRAGLRREGLPQSPRVVPLPAPGGSYERFAKPFVLFVVEDSLPQCRAYRVLEKVAHYRRLNVHVETVSCWAPEDAYGKVAFAAAIHFYRVAALPAMMPLLSEARRLGVPCVWEVDDLIFDVDLYSKHPYFKTAPASARAELLRGAALFSEALTYANVGVASTGPLARALERKVAGPVFVVENCLSDGILALADEAAREKGARPVAESSEVISIGYGSGTLTHDDDYAHIVKALVRILEKHASARLVVFGYLKLPATLGPFADRVVAVPFSDASTYYRMIGELDVNLAPLPPLLFNEAKSNIKWLEAAVFGVPTVASPREPFRLAIDDGVDGFLAESEEEWFRALDVLTTDHRARIRLGAAAREKALRLYHPDVVARTQMRPLIAHLGLDRAAAAAAARPVSEGGAPPRLAAVNVFFAPTSYGGATIVAEDMARSLAGDLGWDVSVFAGNLDDSLPDHFATRYEALGLPVVSVRLPRMTPDRVSYDNPGVLRAFKDFLDVVRPDVVHFHSIQLLGAGLLEECDRRAIPFAVTLHDAWWLCARQFRYINERAKRCEHRSASALKCLECTADPASFMERSRYLKGVLRGAGLLLAPSRFQAELYMDNGFDRERVVVNGNGVRPPRRARARTPRRSPRHVVFAYLGGPSTQKGYHFVKRAFSGLEETDYTLLLTNTELKIGIRTTLGSDFRCGGELVVAKPFDASTIDDFFDGVDVLLVPSQWDECFGLVLREAMIRDVWVVTSDAGALPEAVEDGVNGRVFPRDDLAGFTSAIRECLASPGRFETYVNPNKHRITTTARQAEQLDALLRGLATNHRSPEVAGGGDRK